SIPSTRTIIVHPAAAGKVRQWTTRCSYAVIYVMAIDTFQRVSISEPIEMLPVEKEELIIDDDNALSTNLDIATQTDLSKSPLSRESEIEASYQATDILRQASRYF